MTSPLVLIPLPLQLHSLLLSWPPQHKMPSSTSTPLTPCPPIPKPFCRPPCIVGTALWETDLIIWEAQRVQLDPGTGPINRPTQTPIFSSLAARLFPVHSVPALLPCHPASCNFATRQNPLWKLCVMLTQASTLASAILHQEPQPSLQLSQSPLYAIIFFLHTINTRD